MAIVVPIAADYDGSGVKAAQNSLANFGQSMSKTLAQAGRDARKAFKDVEDGAKESTTAAQRLATAITQSADKLDTELKQSAAAADALGAALGPELAAKLGQNGIKKLVTDLNRAGVSLQEITTEADTLAAAIKKVDDVNLQNVTAETDKLNNGLDETANKADRSGAVFANFAGNAAQEIPGVANALGPLNVAVGQFAEYATEGSISLRGLVTALGPIAAITGALLIVKSVFTDIANTKAFEKENVQAFKKALLDGATAAAALRDRLGEVGKLELRAFDPSAFAGLSGFSQKIPGIVDTITGGVSKIFGVFARSGTSDLTQQALNLGLNADRASKLIAGGADRINQWAAAQRAAGANTEELDKVTRALLQRLEELNKATEGAAVTEQFLIDTTRQSTSATMMLAAANGAAAVAVDQKAAADKAAKEAADAAAQADQNQANAIDAVREALYRRNNARYAQQDADSNARKAIEEYNKAQAKADKTGKASDIAAAAEAADKAERAINGAAAATSVYAGEQYQYASAADQATAKTAASVAELQNLSNLIGKGGKLYTALLQWIESINQVPTEVITRFGISFGSSVTTATPSTSSASSIADTWAANGVFSNSAGVTNVTNITVNGATNSQETADLIQQNQDRSNQRQGTV